MNTPAPSVVKFSEAVAIDGAEIFKVGVWRGKEYTRADLDDMARNFAAFSAPEAEKVLLRVPAVFGHEEDQEALERSDLPAAAWPSRVYVEGDLLKADFPPLNPQVARLIAGKAYDTVSSEVYDRPPDGIPSSGKMLRRIAFLGGDIPEVKGLKSLSECLVPDVHSEARARRVTPGELTIRKVKALPGGAFAVFSEVRKCAEPKNRKRQIGDRVHVDDGPRKGAKGVIVRSPIEGAPGIRLDGEQQGRHVLDSDLKDEAGQPYGPQTPYRANAEYFASKPKEAAAQKFDEDDDGPVSAGDELVFGHKGKSRAAVTPAGHAGTPGDDPNAKSWAQLRVPRGHSWDGRRLDTRTAQVERIARNEDFPPEERMAEGEATRPEIPTPTPPAKKARREPQYEHDGRPLKRKPVTPGWKPKRDADLPAEAVGWNADMEVDAPQIHERSTRADLAVHDETKAEGGRKKRKDDDGTPKVEMPVGPGAEYFGSTPKAATARMYDEDEEEAPVEATPHRPQRGDRVRDTRAGMGGREGRVLSTRTINDGTEHDGRSDSLIDHGNGRSGWVIGGENLRDLKNDVTYDHAEDDLIQPGDEYEVGSKGKSNADGSDSWQKRRWVFRSPTTQSDSTSGGATRVKTRDNKDFPPKERMAEDEEEIGVGDEVTVGEKGKSLGAAHPANANFEPAVAATDAWSRRRVQRGGLLEGRKPDSRSTVERRNSDFPPEEQFDEPAATKPAASTPDAPAAEVAAPKPAAKPVVTQRKALPTRKPAAPTARMLSPQETASRIVATGALPARGATPAAPTAKVVSQQDADAEVARTKTAIPQAVRPDAAPAKRPGAAIPGSKNGRTIEDVRAKVNAGQRLVLDTSTPRGREVAAILKKNGIQFTAGPSKKGRERFAEPAAPAEYFAERAKTPIVQGHAEGKPGPGHSRTRESTFAVPGYQDGGEQRDANGRMYDANEQYVIPENDAAQYGPYYSRRRDVPIADDEDTDDHAEGTMPDTMQAESQQKQQMLEHLANLGMDTSALEDLPEQALAEILRVLDTTGQQPEQEETAPPPMEEPEEPEDPAMTGDPEEEEVAAFDEDEEDDEDDDEEKPRKKPAPPEMFNERAVGKMIADAVSAAVSAAFAAQKADLQKFAEASSGRSKSAVASAKKANVDALIERLSLEGRLPPAEREAIRQRLMRADSSRPAVKFSEKGKQPEMLTEFEAQVRELESRPTLFAERFKMPTAAAASADAEEARIEEHFDAFSERYQKLGQTREKFLGAFRAEKKMRPSVTVDEFLNK